jgi:alanyl-tRNA synthetase
MPQLAKQFAHVFPELEKQVDLVTKVVKEEEDAFLRTLDKGLSKIDDIIKETQSANSKTINGRAAFELYDTYGFPIDLTRLIAAENTLAVDEASFDAEMQQQKNRSRAATTLDTEDWVVIKEGSTRFVGYEKLDAQANILKYRKVKAKGKESYQIVLDTTPFYAESGGQVGDRGELVLENSVINIVDTKKENDLIIHFADAIPEDMDGPLLAAVNVAKRRATAVHHSATHLLHAALRQVLGTHVAQKGSLVNEEHLRFDFSHFSAMSAEEIRKVEEIVNEKIRENIPVVIKEMPKDEAVGMGAMALFGEKYGNTVRVVIMDPNYSIELCGGTHVGSTGELGVFMITHEAAVAAGVRRIEAKTGSAAFEYIYNDLVTPLEEIKKLTKKKAADAPAFIEKLQTEISDARKYIEQLEAQQVAGMKNGLLAKKQEVSGANFIGEIVSVNNADSLKKLCLDLKQSLDNHLIVLCAAIDGKSFVAVGVDDALVAKGIDAGKIIKEHIAPLIKGGGGGQKTLATAGGQDASNFSQVIEKVKSLL